MYKALNRIIGLLFCLTILIVIIETQDGSAQDQYFTEVVINAQSPFAQSYGVDTVENTWDITLNQA